MSVYISIKEKVKIKIYNILNGKEKDEMTMNPQNKTEKEENTLSDVQSAAIADEKQGELETDTEQSVAFASDKENLVEKRAEIEKQCARLAKKT